jgi:hypothetical protein
MGYSGKQNKDAERDPKFVKKCCAIHVDTFAYEFTVHEVFHAYVGISGTMEHRIEEAP